MLDGSVMVYVGGNHIIAGHEYPNNTNKCIGKIVTCHERYVNIFPTLTIINSELFSQAVFESRRDYCRNVLIPLSEVVCVFAACEDASNMRCTSKYCDEMSS